MRRAARSPTDAIAISAIEVRNIPFKLSVTPGVRHLLHVFIRQTHLHARTRFYVERSVSVVVHIS